MAAIGPKTAQILKKHGITPDIVPEVYDSDHLAKALEHITGPVLLCRASKGSSAVPDLLTGKGIAFDDVPCYDTVYASPDPEKVLPLLDRPLTVTFTSASTVRGFAESLPDGDFRNVTGVCIGRQTQAEAQKYGIATVVSQEATMESLIECIRKKEF